MHDLYYSLSFISNNMYTCLHQASMNKESELEEYEKCHEKFSVVYRNRLKEEKGKFLYSKFEIESEDEEEGEEIG